MVRTLVALALAASAEGFGSFREDVLDDFGTPNGGCFCKTEADCTSNGVDIIDNRCYCGFHVGGEAFCYVDADTCPDAVATSRYSVDGETREAT